MTKFKIPLAETQDIEDILNDLDTKKSPGPDLLLPKLVKHVATLIKEPLKKIVNEMVSEKHISLTLQK